MTLLEKIKLRIILSLAEKGRTLDIGCGDQRFTKHLDDPIGVDSSEWNTSHDPQLRNVLDLRAVGEYLPFKDGSFKSVHLHDVLEHIPRIEQVRDEIYRVLEDGGALVQTDPKDLRLFIARLLTGRIRQALHHGMFGQGSGHVHNFNVTSLITLFREKFRLEKSRGGLVFRAYKWRRVDDRETND